MWSMVQENPISNLYTQKMHEVQKHLTLTDHGYLGYAVIVDKKFWDGLPADVRKQLDEAMVQSTRYANQIAKVENDQSLEAVKKSDVPQFIPRRRPSVRRSRRRWCRCTRRWKAALASRPSSRFTRLRASIRTRCKTATIQVLPPEISGGSCLQRGGFMKFLDHLEEWLIAFLMGAATLIIFLSVVHRFGSGWDIPGVQDWLLEINMGWAQELTIIMFVWMAKFGAALTVCGPVSTSGLMC